jgi:alginate O-acetyltransferase complex protein AlgI
MLFNSYEFLIFFILVLTVIVIIKHRQFQHLFIVGASYFFFYFSSNYLLSLLIASTVLDFYIAKEIWNTKDIKRKKILLSISLAGNLGLLGFFKYADFAIDQFNILGNYFELGTSIPYLDLILPIGISFYTFQTISYTVDVYRGHLEPSKSFKEFALFVAFFPQLVAGPILRAKDFLPQLREKIDNSNSISKLRQITIHSTNLKIGITLMVFGFVKKMFFADNIAPLVNEIFANPIGLNSFEIWIGTLAFGIQIYGDFSGYSDIAIGAALILGFKIPFNFNKPYFATSPSDFWRRWHISLSTWLRDYLYIPLGGNKKSVNRTYLNLATVMFLGGLWHGASWNFVIWGMLHGGYLAIHKVISDKFPVLKENKFFKSKIGKIIAILITQYFVFLAWIPFRVNDLDSIIYSMSKYIFFDFQTDGIFSFLVGHKLPVLLMILFISLNFILYSKPNLYSKISNLSLKYWTLFLTIAMIMIISFYNGDPVDFIYFKF